MRPWNRTFDNFSKKKLFYGRCGRGTAVLIIFRKKTFLRQVRPCNRTFKNFSKKKIFTAGAAVEPHFWKLFKKKFFYARCGCWIALIKIFRKLKIFGLFAASEPNFLYCCMSKLTFPCIAHAGQYQKKKKCFLTSLWFETITLWCQN